VRRAPGPHPASPHLHGAVGLVVCRPPGPSDHRLHATRLQAGSKAGRKARTARRAPPAPIWATPQPYPGGGVEEGDIGYKHTASARVLTCPQFSQPCRPCRCRQARGLAAERGRARAPGRVRDRHQALAEPRRLPCVRLAIDMQHEQPSSGLLILQQHQRGLAHLRPPQHGCMTHGHREWEGARCANGSQCIPCPSCACPCPPRKQCSDSESAVHCPPLATAQQKPCTIPNALTLRQRPRGRERRSAGLQSRKTTGQDNAVLWVKACTARSHPLRREQRRAGLRQLQAGRHHALHHGRVHRLRAHRAQAHAAARQPGRRRAHKVHQRGLGGGVDGRDGHREEPPGRGHEHDDACIRPDGSDRTGQAQLWDKCAESAGLPRGVPGLPEAVIARAARRAPTSAPSRFTRSVACQPGPSESTKSPAGRGCRLSTAEHGNVRLLDSDSHATCPCCASELLTSLVDAGIQYSNVYAAVRLDKLRKCCLLRCVARDITLHGPGGAAGACSKPCRRLCCGQVHVCCLPFTRKGKPEYTSSAACARPSALPGRCFAQGSSSVV